MQYGIHFLIKYAKNIIEEAHKFLGTRNNIIKDSTNHNKDHNHKMEMVPMKMARVCQYTPLSHHSLRVCQNLRNNKINRATKTVKTVVSFKNTKNINKIRDKNTLLETQTDNKGNKIIKLQITMTWNNKIL